MIATGDSNGEVKLWDYQFLSLLPGAPLLGHRGEICALSFVEPYPVLISSDVVGEIFFWAVRPSPWAVPIGMARVQPLEIIAYRPEIARKGLSCPPADAPNVNKETLSSPMGSVIGAGEEEPDRPNIYD